MSWASLFALLPLLAFSPLGLLHHCLNQQNCNQNHPKAWHLQPSRIAKWATTEAHGGRGLGLHPSFFDFALLFLDCTSIWILGRTMAKALGLHSCLLAVFWKQHTEC